MYATAEIKPVTVTRNLGAENNKTRKVGYMLGRNDVGDKLVRIIDWADNNPKFKADFVESLYDKYERDGQLTVKQEEALDNIIDRFKIE